MKSFAFLCIMCGFLNAHAQRKTHPAATPAASSPAVSSESRSDYVEVTKEDFVALPKITSTQLLSFGVRLGMSRNEALKALQDFTSQVVARPNKEGDIDVIAGSDTVMNLHFDQDQSPVSKIECFPPMMKFLPGRSRDLLTPAAFTPDSSVRLELLVL